MLGLPTNEIRGVCYMGWGKVKWGGWVGAMGTVPVCMCAHERLGEMGLVVKEDQKLSGRKFSDLKIKVKWVNLVKLKRRSFWVIEEETGNNGRWKALLELRDKIRPSIIHEIRNGRDVSIWNDNWCNMWHLSHFVTHKDIYDARMDEDCSVVDMIDNNKWVWPEQWVNKFVQLSPLKVRVLINNKKDVEKQKKKNRQMVD
nr:RNA-directed DNA polymerase, eukaryota, reverse transcriptase zinc-binding domain protein [Tanacetum cinerariifolium]